jgi:hypothetical protein
MTLSRSIDFTREKDRYLQLPERGMQRTVLMTPAQAATFSAACSCRVLGMRAV